MQRPIDLIDIQVGKLYCAHNDWPTNIWKKENNSFSETLGTLRNGQQFLILKIVDLTKMNAYVSTELHVATDSVVGYIILIEYKDEEPYLQNNFQTLKREIYEII